MREFFWGKIRLCVKTSIIVPAWRFIKMEFFQTNLTLEKMFLAKKLSTQNINLVGSIFFKYNISNTRASINMNFVPAWQNLLFSLLNLVKAIKQPKILFKIFTVYIQMIPDEIFKYRIGILWKNQKIDIVPAWRFFWFLIFSFSKQLICPKWLSKSFRIFIFDITNDSRWNFQI